MSMDFRLAGMTSPEESSLQSKPGHPAGPDVTAIVQGLRRITKALEEYSREVYRAYGLTGPQLWALKTLYRRGPLTAGELAAALVVHQSSVSVLVARLERRRLVRRVRRRNDRRYVEITLTPAGRDLAEQSPEPAQGRLLHQLRGMGAADVAQIRQSIDTLVTAMAAGGVEARFFFES
ncbi:MAG: MarR family winged helix-turn-helix transcriptional regulator [Gemmatimonadales bacterium]